MRRAALLPLVCLAGCALLASIRASGAGARRTLAAPLAAYGSGWDLVSGPAGSTLAGASALYTLQAGDTGYENLSPSAPLQSGWGYWAYFPNGGALQPATDATAYSATFVPGAWVMLGDPSATQSAGVSGASTVLLYSAGGGYQTATSIPPGQGAFVSGSGTATLAVMQPVAPAVQATPPPVLGVVGIASVGLQSSDLPGYTMRGATGGVPLGGGAAAYIQSWRDLRPGTVHYAVDEALLSYQSTAGAVAGVQAVLQQLQQVPKIIGLQLLGPAGIEDQDQELSYSSFASTGAALDVNVVVFRDATLVVEITTYDLQGNGSLPVALAYARIVAGRCAAAFGH